MKESSDQFESRKRDHLRLALEKDNQATGHSKLDEIGLKHEALPDLNFENVSIQDTFWGAEVSAPLFISSMTAGHPEGLDLNLRLAKIAEARKWAMGVGSQRRELFDAEAAQEWKALRKKAPRALLFGNIGISQVITSSVRDIQTLVDNLEAHALFVHLNPLQECLQKEGTPQFQDGYKKLTELCQKISVPVVAKEVGTGISASTSKKLLEAGVRAIDVAGLGGTHWGRLEGARSSPQSLQGRAAQVFADWGLSTAESLLENVESFSQAEFWASGGVRSGLDAAKFIAMGAKKVGVAMPILKAALASEQELDKTLAHFEFELRVALFCTGSGNLKDLSSRSLWSWKS